MTFFKRSTIRVALTALALCLPAMAFAQAADDCSPKAAISRKEPTNFSVWLKCEIKAAVERRKVAENGNDVANQKESPSADETSTSLVDTSSASDFVSMALNLTGLQQNDDQDSTPASGSVTVSLYSLAAAVKGKAITDPDFYKNGTALRRLSLTIGTEESKAADHFTDKPSTNVGAKLLIVNHRDVYSGAAQTEFNTLDKTLDSFLGAVGPVQNEVECLIFRAVVVAANRALPCTSDPAFAPFLVTIPFDQNNWPKTLATLETNTEAMEQLNGTIERLALLHEGMSTAISTTVERVQKGKQLAFAYFTKLREDDGTDEHRAELIFDYGLSERLNWTVNASLDYRDRKQSDDTRSGRFATEFQAELSRPDNRLWSARPVTLSGSGEAKKASGSEALIRAQVKLVVPIMTGVDIPIAYTYANRDDEGVESGSQLKLSLAIDPVRLRERLRLPR